MTPSTFPMHAMAQLNDQVNDQVIDAEAFEALVQTRLFERATGGDRDAIEQVWRQNRRWIAAVLAAHAPRGCDVDDLLQEVAAVFITKARHLRDAASLRGWLRTVAVNEARMAARDKKIEQRSLRSIVEVAVGRKGVMPVTSEDARATLELLSKLPALYAEPLMLQAAQGLSQRQIAELLDVPETTIETRLARARRMLRQLNAQAEERAAGM